MPKTRNAFAFRNVDETRILQRPYFRQFNLPNKSDVEIIQSLQAADDDSVDTMENKLDKIISLRNRIDSLYNLTISHLGRLVRLSEKRTKQNKETPNIIRYTIIVDDIFMLLENILITENQSEKKIQKKYRAEFTARLRHYRQAAGLTQKELGYLIHVSPTVISRYMKGKRDIPIYELIRIAKALNVSADKLLGIT